MVEEKIETANSGQTSQETKKEMITPASMIDQANAAAARLEQANKDNLEILRRHEQLAVEMRLGGKSEAGKPQEKKKDDPLDDPIAYAKALMNGDVNPLKP